MTKFVAEYRIPRAQHPHLNVPEAYIKSNLASALGAEIANHFGVAVQVCKATGDKIYSIMVEAENLNLKGKTE